MSNFWSFSTPGIKTPAARTIMIILAILIAIAIAFTTPGCGGGGGGGNEAAAADPNEKPAVSYSRDPDPGTGTWTVVSGQLVTLGVVCSNESGGAITATVDFGDGTTPTPSFACGSTARNVTYKYNTTSNRDFTVSVTAVNAKGNARTVTAGISVTVASSSTVTGAPTISSIVLNPQEITEDQTTSIRGAFQNPADADSKCLITWGDGLSDQVNDCTSAGNTHKYNGVAQNPSTFNVCIQPFKGNTLGNTECRQVKVWPPNSAAIGAPWLKNYATDANTAWTTIDTNYVAITKAPSGSSFTFEGLAPTGADSLWMKPEWGDEVLVTTFSSGSSTTWSKTVSFAEQTQGAKNILFYAKKNGAKGSELKVRYTVDTIAPEVPYIATWQTPTCLATQTLSIRYTNDAELYKNNVQVSPVLDDTATYRYYNDTVTHTTSGTFTYRYKAKDARGNTSSEAVVTIVRNSTCGSTGGGGGGGTTNPSGPQASFSVSPTSGGTSTSFGFTYACTQNCSNVTCAISYGDGSAGYNDAGCDGGSVSHTFSSSGTYTAQLTISGTDGSNNFNQTVSVGTGSTSYADYYTSWNSTANDIAFNGSYIYALNTSTKCITRYNSSGGDGTDWCTRISTQPEAFTNPSKIAYCPEGKIVVLDPTPKKVYVFNSSDMSYVTSFTSSFTTPVGIGCGTGSSGNLIYVADAGLNKIYQFNTSGGLNWIYSGTLNTPNSVAVDSNGIAFVTEQGGSRVVKIDTDGSFISSFVSGLSTPTKISIYNGTVFVAEFGLKRISVFDSNGNGLGNFGSAGTGSGQFQNINGIGILSNQYFIADSTAGKILKFQ